MNQIKLSRFFPAPGFLRISSVGVDISDRSIKFAELLPKRKKLSLGRFGEKKLEPGIIVSGKIRDQKKLVESLSALKREHNLDFVRVSLPEEQIYLFRLTIPRVEPAEVRGVIELQLEEHVPISLAEAVFDYDFIGETPKGYELQVLALSSRVIESYLSIFKQSGLNPLSMELEAQAVARTVIHAGDPGTYIVIDFGDARTGVLIVSGGVILFTSTVDVGGITLTNMIERAFQVSFEEAEKLKKENGLQRNKENKELFSVLLNGVSVLRDEISRHFIYWQTHKDESGKDRPKIEKIILCGGDSNLKGLADYLATSLRMKVEIADAWTNIPIDPELIPEIGFSDSLSYVTALGLALGDFEYD